VAPPVFKTGLAGNTLAGRFDSFPPPPSPNLKGFRRVAVTTLTGKAVPKTIDS
jgi:hypothetical protein